MLNTTLLSDRKNTLNQLFNMIFNGLFYKIDLLLILIFVIFHTKEEYSLFL